ncbi:hypothetical protein DA2_2935 [Desulfovibrio sp. A2]|nr:hypothetical protein DA2_2935 [Desulfovibrio sp. A2]
MVPAPKAMQTRGHARKLQPCRCGATLFKALAAFDRAITDGTTTLSALLGRHRRARDDQNIQGADRVAHRRVLTGLRFHTIHSRLDRSGCRYSPGIASRSATPYRSTATPLRHPEGRTRPFRVAFRPPFFFAAAPPPTTTEHNDE